MDKKDIEGAMRADLERERAVLRALSSTDVAATAKRVRDDKAFLDLLAKSPGKWTNAEQEYVLQAVMAFYRRAA